MNVFLLHPDRDFDVGAPLPVNQADLTQDLELGTLFDAMAAGDPFLYDMARRAVLSSAQDRETILYRQRILADCLSHPAIVRAIYATAVEALEGERRGYFIFMKGASPSSILHSSVRVLETFVELLTRLRDLASEHAHLFTSDGFSRFFSMLQEQLTDEYFQVVRRHLKELLFPEGALLSAKLGPGNKARRYVLRLPERAARRRWMLRSKRSGYSFRIAERDESGARALSDIEAQGINLVANALAQSADHIRSFFQLLRTEMAFYVGCLNLYEQLSERDLPTCWADPVASPEPQFSCADLYDVCLSLHVSTTVTPNSVDAQGRRLVVITGANRGGKSTFLRSVGVAQLMMQSGMFAPARKLSADICAGVFTHYKREEDSSMEHGKLDEELARMREIVGAISQRSLLLCNESFASTNEREGSEIGRHVVEAFLQAGVKVFLVTHLFDLAESLDARHRDALFLRAERQETGRRTFRVVAGEPSPTSHGMDLYRRVFSVQAVDQEVYGTS